MAGIRTDNFEMFEQLRQDGWYIYDMKPYDHKIFDVIAWCRESLGNMLTVYDADILSTRWHGSQVDTYGAGIMLLFAFKDEADYTMLKLKFA